MATKAKVERLLAKTNATIYDILEWQEGYTVTLDAPEGHYFLCNGLHVAVAQGWDKPMLWRTMAEDLNYGTKACDSSCESCNN